MVATTMRREDILRIIPLIVGKRVMSGRPNQPLLVTRLARKVSMRCGSWIEAML
jgi:hypothetical protein